MFYNVSVTAQQQGEYKVLQRNTSFTSVDCTMYTNNSCTV